MNNTKKLYENITTEQLLWCKKNLKTDQESAEFLGMTTKKYVSLLWQRGILGDVKKYRFKNFPHIDYNWLVENWVNTTDSLKTIADREGIGDSLLEFRTSFYGLSKNRKYKINTQKLFDLSDPHIYYIAGLLASDGFVGQNADFISIRMLGESEEELFKNILSYYESDFQLRHYTRCGKTQVEMKLSAVGVRDFFEKKFCIPKKNKTFLMGFPDFFHNDDCVKAFVRGCFDGDGCISHIKRSKSPTAVLLTASDKFIDGMCEKIRQFGINVNRGTERGYPVLRIGGSQNVLKFLNWMYSGECTFRLERKYEKYLMVKDIVCSTDQAEQPQMLG